MEESFSKMSDPPSTIPFGREEEVRLMENALQQIRNGSPSVHVVLVHGAAGVGKTTLVETFLANHQNNILCGSDKIDQVHSVEPFSAIATALSEVCGRLIQNEDARAFWRHRLAKLDRETGLRELAKLIPKINDLMDEIGEKSTHHGQSREDRIRSSNSYEQTPWLLGRIRHALRAFCREIATHAGPLVLYIDDLQWIDVGTLSMLKQLVCDSQMRNFLFIGSYRDNEISDIDPWARCYQEWQEMDQIEILSVTVGNLYRQTANQLVSTVLGIDAFETTRLSGLIYMLSSGNPLQHLQLLTYIQNQGHVKAPYDSDCTNWTVDLERVEGELEHCRYTSVTELVASKIRDLPNETQLMLKIAACLASHFTVDVLVRILKLTEHYETLDDIKATVDEKMKEMIDMGIVRVKQKSGRDHQHVYAFAHDKVQQAALELDTIGMKDNVFLIVGTFLLDLHESTEDSEDWELLVATDLLNRTSGFFEPKRKLVKLNIASAKLSLERLALDSVLTFVENGISILREEDAWIDENYSVTLELYTMAAETHFSLGRMADCYNHIETVLTNARTIEEKLRVQCIRVDALSSQGRILDALGSGCQVLGELGFSVTTQPSKVHAISSLVRTIMIMRRFRDDEQIRSLPPMLDAKKLAAMNVFSRLTAYALYCSPNLFVISALQMVRLSVRYGIADSSPMAFALYGVLMGAVGDFNQAFRYGNIALSMVDQVQSPRRLSVGVMAVHHMFLNHLRHPPQESLEPLRYVYQTGYECGDITIATQAASLYGYTCLLCGVALRQVVDDMKGLAERLSQSVTYCSAQLSIQTALCLLGETNDAVNLDMSSYEWNDVMSDNFPRLIRSEYFFFQMLLTYIFGDLARAEEFSSMICSQDGPESTMVAVAQPLRLVLAGLVDASMCRTSGERKYWHRFRKALKLLKKWMKRGVTYVQSFIILLEAKHLILIGAEELRILDGFDRACYQLVRDSFVGLAAMAYEEAALYLSQNGNAAFAKSYMTRAIALYESWGALSKVAGMRQEHAFLSNWTPDQSIMVPSLRAHSGLSYTYDDSTSTVSLGKPGHIAFASDV